MPNVDTAHLLKAIKWEATPAQGSVAIRSQPLSPEVSNVVRTQLQSTLVGAAQADSTHEPMDAYEADLLRPQHKIHFIAAGEDGDKLRINVTGISPQYFCHATGIEESQIAGLLPNTTIYRG